MLLGRVKGAFGRVRRERRGIPVAGGRSPEGHSLKRVVDRGSRGGIGSRAGRATLEDLSAGRHGSASRTPETRILSRRLVARGAVTVAARSRHGTACRGAVAARRGAVAARRGAVAAHRVTIAARRVRIGVGRRGAVLLGRVKEAFGRVAVHVRRNSREIRRRSWKIVGHSLKRVVDGGGRGGIGSRVGRFGRGIEGVRSVLRVLRERRGIPQGGDGRPSSLSQESCHLLRSSARALPGSIRGFSHLGIETNLEFFSNIT